MDHSAAQKQLDAECLPSLSFKGQAMDQRPLLGRIYELKYTASEADVTSWNNLGCDQQACMAKSVATEYAHSHAVCSRQC